MFKNIRWGSVLCGFLLGTAGTRLIRTQKARKLAEDVATGGYIAREYILGESEHAQTWVSDVMAAGRERAEEYIGRSVTAVQATEEAD